MTLHQLRQVLFGGDYIFPIIIGQIGIGGFHVTLLVSSLARRDPSFVCRYVRSDNHI